MTRADNSDDAIREEFLAEANEIVESLSRDLLVLDQGQNERSHELVNEVFRGVHTLKGMAGMFGYQQVSAVAHELENLLDDLRVGRIELNREVLDVLFAGVETFQKLLAADQGGEADDATELSRNIERLASQSRQPRDPLKVYDLPETVLSVLTEYEEHRLRTNVLEEVPLYRYRVTYPLLSIDVALEALKQRAKPLGEIITYLPSIGAAGSDAIDLEILFASRVKLGELVATIASDGGTLEAVPRAKPSYDTRPPEESGTQPPPAPGMLDRAGTEQGALASPAHEAGAELATMRTVGHSVRVDIRKLDHLMNVVSELSLARAIVERATESLRRRPELRALMGELHRANRALERNLADLQEGILGVRMVPLKQLFERVQRGVRQVARDSDKDLGFSVSGAETELDKLLVEELSDPLMHIVRNCIDHGIEPSVERVAAGKPAVGTIAINAYQKGNHVVVEVEDDGRGIDVRRLSEKAVSLGLVSQGEAEGMGRDELLGLVFLPGLSTAAKVTDISGRGVGMDVVRHNIAKLGGVVDVQSEAGTGTKFTITVPITLAIIRVLVVSVARRLLTIPLSAVREAFVLDPSGVRRVDGREVVSLRRVTLNIARLDAMLNLKAPGSAPRQFVVVAMVGSRTVGFVVDELLGQQDVVIKALGASLAGVRGFAGAAELGGGDVALVMDVPALIEEALDLRDAPRLEGPRS